MKKVFKHFWVITKHRYRVLKLCFKAGIPFRGLVHDLSKYSPSEFFESVRYFKNGDYSPIKDCKKEIGYSMAWINHTRRNKHHHEYWYDYGAREIPPIPYKYAIEMVCDTLAAGQTYMKKKWTKSYQLQYYQSHRSKININNKIDKFLLEVYNKISEEGINKVLKKKNLKNMYKQYVKGE